jgi:tRNA A-37 threonylcarbamoyl transferase component Bud32
VRLILKATTADPRAGELELEYSMKLSEEKIGPRIYYNQRCNQGIYVIVIMERYDMTVSDYLEQIMRAKNVKELVDGMLAKVRALVDRLHHSLKLYHNDLHIKNVVVNVGQDKNVTDIRLIDFGKMSRTARRFEDYNVRYPSDYEEFELGVKEQLQYLRHYRRQMKK